MKVKELIKILEKLPDDRMDYIVRVNFEWRKYGTVDEAWFLDEKDRDEWEIPSWFWLYAEEEWY